MCYTKPKVMITIGLSMTVKRPTENEALRNIKWVDIERISSVGNKLTSTDWLYVLMVKHINFGLGGFAGDIVMQFDNPDIQRIVARRLDQSLQHTQDLMTELFSKMLRREYDGLPAIPPCTPYEEIINHRERLMTISKRHNVYCAGYSAKKLTRQQTVLVYR